jgi:hypothetical protein
MRKVCLGKYKEVNKFMIIPIMTILMPFVKYRFVYLFFILFFGAPDLLVP